MSQEDVFNVESDNDSNSSSNDSQQRTTRNSLSRFAKKSTGSTQEVVVKQPAITRRQVALAAREKQKFLGSFNPETSDREKRKLDKKLQQSRKTQGLTYDSRGIHIATGVNLCDCFEVSCPGCFYPCRKCGSRKCGIECRTNRKSKYESIEYHGYNITKRFPLEK